MPDNVKPGLEFYSLAELEAECLRKRELLERECEAGTKHWGNWRYNPEEPASLDIGTYQIVLDRIDTVAKLGDWCLHMAEKQWLTPDDLGQLIKAIWELSTNGIHSVRGRGVA